MKQRAALPVGRAVGWVFRLVVAAVLTLIMVAIGVAGLTDVFLPDRVVGEGRITTVIEWPWSEPWEPPLN